MINFNYDPSDPFELYKSAVGRKTGDDKAILINIEGMVRDCYHNYDSHKQTNTLETITPTPRLRAHKKELLSLYGSDKKIIKTFRKYFFNRCIGTYRNLCPYCTLSEANTTEHILPKNTYPEFAVNVHNLIPACSLCNEKKGETVINDNGDKVLINFYKDILPNKAYLKVDIVLFEGKPIAKFKLENRNNEIESGLYSLIERHFEKLELIERFNLKSIQVLTSIIIDYQKEGMTKSEEYDRFASKQLTMCNLMRTSLGYNHWEISLREAAAKSDIFKRFILSI